MVLQSQKSQLDLKIPFKIPHLVNLSKVFELDTSSFIMFDPLNTVSQVQAEISF